MNKRTLKKGLAAVFSAFMSISGVDPVFAEDSTNNANNPETITVLYGIGPGSISVTQDGETIKYETTGEQKVLTLTRNEADSIQITATADDGTNVYHFDEYYAGAETDIEYIETPTSTATQEIDFDGTKVVEIAFSDTNAMNAIMPLGAACSQGQYATEGYAGMATFAETQRGTPYLFNTQGFNTYDCSGLVARAAWAINWMEGWNIGSSTSGWNSYLSQNFEYDTYDLRNGYTPSSKTKRGDIVIFYEDASYSSTYHMAIMLDNTNMIGAINGFGQYAGVTSAISVPQWPELGTYGHKDDAPYCRIFHLTNEVPTKVSVEKKSSKAEITDGNSLYSLEGAEYAIYKDSGCTQQVATVTTDATGKGTSAEFSLDASVTTLYAKETKAPANGTYKLNQSVIPFSVSNGHGSFEATDEPLNDPLSIQISKLSSDGTIIDDPASMEGAQFTVKYYTGEYNSVSELAGVAPERTWILETKKVGNVYLAGLSDSYKVGGDSFYYNEYNYPVLYLGTVTIEETKAPAGYTTEGSVSYKIDGQTQTATEVDGVALFKLLNENGSVSFKTANGLSIDNAEITKEEQVTRGSLEIQKVDSENGTQAQDGSTGLNATFTIHNDNAYEAVMRGENDVVLGPAEANSDFTYTITTDANGYWKSAAGFLPAGKYTIRETGAPSGYLGTNATYSFEIKEGVTTITCLDTFENDVIRGGVKLQKHDSETGTRPQGDTNLQISFNIVSNNDNPVIVNGQTFDKNDVVFTGTTDEKGFYESAADLLPYGSYTLNETNAPAGCTSNGNTSVTFSITDDGAIVDLSNGEIRNNVALGGITIHKIFTDVDGTNWTVNEPGAVFGVVREEYVDQYGSVADAIAHQYGVTTAEVTDREWLYANLFGASNTADTTNKDGSDPDLMTGHEYAVMKTDDNGDGTTGAQALAYGRYIVAQLASGDNEITVSDAKYTVDITSDGTMIPLQASNVPQTYFIRMVKRDADTGELVTLNSAEFKIFQLEDARGEEVNEYVTMKVGSVTYNTFRTTSDNGSSNLPAGTFYAVGEDAGTVTTPLKLESGLYRIEEVATPEGFISADPISAEVKLENISEVDDEGNNFITVTISDPRAYGELTVTKSVKDVVADADLIPADVLQQIEFTLIADEDIINPDDGSVLTAKGDPAKDINGNVVGVFHPNANGEVTISKIALGHYTLTETYIPAELALPAETWDVDFIQPDDDRTTLKYSVDLDIENKPTYIELSKKAVTGDDELPGAQISVIEKATGLEVVSFTSGTEPYSTMKDSEKSGSFFWHFQP